MIHLQLKKVKSIVNKSDMLLPTLKIEITDTIDAMTGLMVLVKKTITAMTESTVDTEVVLVLLREASTGLGTKTIVKIHVQAVSPNH